MSCIKKNLKEHRAGWGEEMAKRHYVVIEDFMLDDMDLTMPELLIYATIYGFCMAEGCMFTGRLKYLADTFHISISTVKRTLKSLTEKGYIRERKGILGGAYSKCKAYEVTERQFNLNGQTGQNARSQGFKMNGQAGQNEPSIYIDKPIKENDIDKGYTESKEREKKFNLFWNEYPKHEAKQNALREFEKLAPDNSLFETMMDALRKVKKSKQWQDVQYIPYPATWIRQRRWEDDMEEIKSKDNMKGETTYDIEKIQKEAEEIKEFSL